MLQIRLKDAGRDDAVALTQKTILGSHPLVDVVVGDESHRDIWPTHAVISKAGKRHMLIALDPKALVKLNGQPVQQTAVKAGDVVQIGAFELLVEEAHSATGDAVARLLAAAPGPAEAPTATAGGDTGTKRRSRRVDEWGRDAWELPVVGTEGGEPRPAPAPATGSAPAAGRGAGTARAAGGSAASAALPAGARMPERAGGELSGGGKRSGPPPATNDDVQVELDMSDMPAIGWGQHALPTAGAAAPPPTTRQPTTRRPAPAAPDAGRRGAGTGAPAGARMPERAGGELSGGGERSGPPPAEFDDGVRIEEPVDMRAAASAPAAPPAPRRPEAPVDEPEPIAPDDPLLLPKDQLPKRAGSPTRKTRTIKGRRAASGRLQAVGADGRLDVDASILAHSKRVEVADLAKKTDTVRVLNYSTIKALIDDAVADAAAVMGAKLEKGERDKLLQEAENEFRERLEAFQSEKRGLEAQALTLQTQLRRATQLLEDERKREVKSEQFTMSEAGITDMEERFGRLLRGAVQGGQIDAGFQAQIQEMIQHMLDDEREKIAEHARAAQSESIALLEKKIRRLAGSLEEAEAEASKQARRAQMLEAMGGAVRGVEADTGIDDDDPDAERKLALMKEIFEQNQEIREQLKGLGVELKPAPGSDERLKARAEAEAARRAKEAAKAAQRAADEAEDAVVDAADAAADLTGDAQDLPEPIAASAEPPAAEEAATDGDSSDATAAHPDDEVWQPGMSFRSEPELGDADEPDMNVRKLAAFKKFEPPPLERR